MHYYKIFILLCLILVPLKSFSILLGASKPEEPITLSTILTQNKTGFAIGGAALLACGLADKYSTWFNAKISGPIKEKIKNWYSNFRAGDPATLFATGASVALLATSTMLYIHHLNNQRLERELAKQKYVGERLCSATNRLIAQHYNGQTPTLRFWSRGGSTSDTLYYDLNQAITYGGHRINATLLE